MDYSKKPTVFFFGEKRKNTPPEPTMTREQMEQCKRNSKQYERKSKDKKD